LCNAILPIGHAPLSFFLKFYYLSPTNAFNISYRLVYSRDK
jgi:hypothetical protein